MNMKMDLTKGKKRKKYFTNINKKNKNKIKSSV